MPKSFHPNYPDMVSSIEEVTAALLAFCSELAGRDCKNNGVTPIMEGAPDD
jgi:hypothetical protein